MKEDLGDIILEDPLEEAVKTEVKSSKDGKKKVRERSVSQDEKDPQSIEEKVVDQKKEGQKR